MLLCEIRILKQVHFAVKSVKYTYSSRDFVMWSVHDCFTLRGFVLRRSFDVN